MYLGYEQIAVSNTALTNSSLTIPAGATHAEIQADTQNVGYTMDNVTDPTVSSGMIFLTTSDPKSFVVEDVSRMRFIRSGGVDSVLNIHYFGGRDV